MAYRLQVVHHGSHVQRLPARYPTKAEARAVMTWYARIRFPLATVKRSGDDARLILREGRITHTVSIEPIEKGQGDE